MGLLLDLQDHSWLLVVAVAATYLVNRVYVYYRLRAFKGPLVAGWSDWWHSWAILSLDAHRKYADVNAKYGPIARIAPNHLVTSDPDVWARVNAVRSPYVRAPWYYHCARIQPGKDNVFSQCDDEKHEKRRKQLVAGYSGKENAHLEASIDARIEDLISLIRTKYISKAGNIKPMDLAKKCQYLTLDVISEVALGTSFGNLKADTDVDNYCQSCEEGLTICNATLGLGIAWIIQIPLIGNLLLPSEKDKDGYGKMIATARHRVNTRLARPTDEKSDMIASFVRHGVSKDDVLTEALEQILAGSDTTASALRSILLYLLTNPRVYRKLQAEVDVVVKAGKVGPSPTIISDVETRQLKYMHAVIREGMRMLPPVANIFSKLVPRGGDTVTVDGKSVFLPGGVLIGYNALGLHHNKAVYGENADQYWPERWLVEEDQERLIAMTRTSDMMFGYGKWHCLGKNIAVSELNKTIFELMRNFDWGMMHPDKPWKSKNIMGLFAQSDLWVQITDRAVSNTVQPQVVPNGHFGEQ